jgi:hypothetical protein
MLKAQWTTTLEKPFPPKKNPKNTNSNNQFFGWGGVARPQTSFPSAFQAHHYLQSTSHRWSSQHQSVITDPQPPFFLITEGVVEGDIS